MATASRSRSKLDQSLGYRLEQWDLELAYRPGDFIQVNAGVNEAMVAQALDWLKPTADERVLDLFCGLGNFALPLAQSRSRSGGGGGRAGDGRAGSRQRR
jgi:tRNA/tmRNA/rRNA uracil-C5-methylase (TrmA/RlmC/RlmD family)